MKMVDKKDRNSYEVLSCFSRGSSRKKGQQMTLATIIAIVLGLVVLVFLIYGFSTGWGNLWSRITVLGGGDVNVDVIKTSCVLACQQKNTYGFCNQMRKVTIETGASNTSTCKAFTKEVNFGKGDDLKEISIGIVDCPGIKCSPENTEESSDGS